MHLEETTYTKYALSKTSKKLYNLKKDQQESSIYASCVHHFADGLSLILFNFKVPLFSSLPLVKEMFKVIMSLRQNCMKGSMITLHIPV